MNTSLLRIRDGYLLFGLAEILIFAGFIILFNEILNTLGSMISSNATYITSFNATIVTGIVLSSVNLVYPVILESLGALVGLIGSIFSYMGFKSVRGNGVAGSILALIGFILFPLYGWLGFILAFIGFLLMMTSLNRIANDFNESSISTGAILSLIPIISIFGCFIVAYGLNKASKVSVQQLGYPQQSFIPQQPAFSSPVEQVGLGVIKGNGEVILTLNSKIQGTIVSAKIENTSYLVSTSIPLVMGINNVVINFGTPLSLMQSTTYPITLVITTYGSTFSMVVYGIFNP